MEPPIVVAVPVAAEPRDMSFYVTKANIEDPTIGPSDGCVACEQIAFQGRASVRHSAACRERVVGVLAARGGQRLLRHRETKAQDASGAEGPAEVGVRPPASATTASGTGSTSPGSPPTPLGSAEGERIKTARVEGPGAGASSVRVRAREEEEAVGGSCRTAGSAAAAIEQLYRVAGGTGTDSEGSA